MDLFSDYIVYVDESGDHGLQNLDPNYPLFVLAFCIFNKRYYCEKVVPAFQQFKFRHFGHDNVVLHEHEIRKERGQFTMFRSREQKLDFLAELTDIIQQSNFVLICCVIEKQRLIARYPVTHNPYHIALGHGMERIYRYLQEKNQAHRQTHLVVERRGKREDDELELEFRRISDGANYFNQPLPLTIEFADKKVNSTGMQLADLVARPVGLHVLRPDQPNRAYDVLKPKFYCRGGRDNVGRGIEGWGLKRFP